MVLRCTQQDGSCSKVQELAAYVSSKWNDAQSNIPSSASKMAAGKAATVKRMVCSFALPSHLRSNCLRQEAVPSRSSESLLRSSKYGSYAMKGFCFLLAVMLTAMPVAGTAQATQSSTPPAATAAPATTPAQQTAPPEAPAANVAGPNYAGPVDASRYIIGPEDSLQVTVWKEPTLSGTIPVRPDGMISLVLVGDMAAAGLTPMALGADISQRLKKYIQDPVVTVVVLGVNSQRIFLVGEVGHVGPLMLTPGMTVLQAIVSAGGLTHFASSKRIYILRTVAGKQQKMPFNYKQALKGENEGVSLLPGDTIVVP
jgi:polysaccharide export outer membrane protein